MTTPVEMVQQERCPECGQPRWRTAMCVCGHAVYLHDFGTRKGMTMRTACSVTDESGHCECRLFGEAAGD